ncbi:WecB/TagA/CpsF family glycosyltransferase [Maribacter luteus]|uniref:WecB/TagA/CpsF family glycosyltransferase n=1 Tax=Maribacter luteus TaxID=2594478 RepID=UPI0024935E0D|nr:WecB/TagA/CpsF family glycosyltransferase [Maribacter luteus]
MISKTSIRCMGYDVFTGDNSALMTIEKTVINTINQYSYCVAEKDTAFKAALKASDILLPDGVGITKAARLLKGEKIRKIAGADLHAYLLEQMNENRGSCFYLGASQTTLKKIEQRLATEYPNIRVGSFSPPFKPAFTAEDNERMIREVNTFAPDVLFIGMTAPKQEKWSLEHKDSLNVKGPICAIGAVFDFYAGTVKRPGKVWRDLGLEWLGRLLKEPKRMWKRYIYNGVVFGGYLLKEKFLSKSAPEQC